MKPFTDVITGDLGCTVPIPHSISLELSVWHNVLSPLIYFFSCPSHCLYFPCPLLFSSSSFFFFNIPVYSLTLCPWPQTSKRSSQSKNAPPSPSKAPGVANRQFSVARWAVAVANPYHCCRPQAPSNCQLKSPYLCFPAQGKVSLVSQWLNTHPVLFLKTDFQESKLS